MMKPINTVCVFIFSVASCTATRANDEDSKMEMMTSEIRVSDPVIKFIHFMYPFLFFDIKFFVFFENLSARLAALEMRSREDEEKPVSGK